MWLIDHYNRYYDAGFGPDLYQNFFNDFCIDSKGRLYFASKAFIRYDPYEERTENYTENAGVISSKCSSTVCDKMTTFGLARQAKVCLPSNSVTMQRRFL